MAIGLGLAAFTKAALATCVVAAGLTVWRFVLARLDCEKQGSMHLQQRGVAGRLATTLNFVADIPWLLVAIWLAFLQGHALWLFGSAQILAYSFLVRASHYELFKGPVTYVSALLSLALSTVLLWPVFSTGAIDWEGINVLVLSGAGSFYYLVQAVRCSTPKRQRVLPAVFCGTLGILTLIGVTTRITIDFSSSALFAAPCLNWQTGFTLLAAFALPIGLNEALMQLADAAQLEIAESDKPRRNPL